MELLGLRTGAVGSGKVISTTTGCPQRLRLWFTPLHSRILRTRSAIISCKELGVCVAESRDYSTRVSAPSNAPRKVSALRRIAAALGPSVITGAADDDPSGIPTYSITGAQFGTRFPWTAPVLWPLMVAAQMMCARIGLVTGQRQWAIGRCTSSLGTRYC